eukprot:CAMPEP_0174895184 /NCGR_PEP_ID=MMETSP0167-20121228/9650_1 /TAXON_ID=38298 /ORGANISM="Rhodella maculata, Strain CCMP736" /LENGTH=153 /DNA_ID=CAMNT_0016134453 /DNA_START=12 /DNA_END=470 /DNA_ORIENTATION=+
MRQALEVAEDVCVGEEVDDVVVGGDEDGEAAERLVLEHEAGVVEGGFGFDVVEVGEVLEVGGAIGGPGSDGEVLDDLVGRDDALLEELEEELEDVHDGDGADVFVDARVPDRRKAGVILHQRLKRRINRQIRINHRDLRTRRHHLLRLPPPQK